jgi:hypothetical protein
VEIVFAYVSAVKDLWDNLALDAIRYTNGSSAIKSKPNKEYV